MSKILAVTGATGPKSGSAFLKILIKENKAVEKLFPEGVRLLVRNVKKLNQDYCEINNVKVYGGDLTNVDYLNDALKNVDTLVHIAGIQMTEKIVDAAVKNHVRRLILVHTTGIYSKYKEAGEGYRLIDEYTYRTCAKNNIVLSILRPTMIYGNVSDMNVVKFIEMVDKFPIMPVVNGARYKLQPVHYEDLAKAYYDVLMDEEKTADKDFILSGGSEIMLRDMLSIIGEYLGKETRFISCPFPIAYFFAWCLYIISLKNFDYREKVQRLCEPRVYSYEDAAKTFGYCPRSFRDGVKAEVNEYIVKMR